MKCHCVLLITMFALPTNRTELYKNFPQTHCRDWRPVTFQLPIRQYDGTFDGVIEWFRSDISEPPFPFVATTPIFDSSRGSQCSRPFVKGAKNRTSFDCHSILRAPTFRWPRNYHCSVSTHTKRPHKIKWHCIDVRAVTKRALQDQKLLVERYRKLCSLQLQCFRSSRTKSPSFIP